jgi:tetratricopeptide (TPR) repeat protein
MCLRTKLRISVWTLVAVVALVAAVPAFAQVGRISGVVMDETGEPIKGATIRATSQQNYPGSLTTTSDERGRFSFIVQRSGQWDFLVEAPGFASTVGTSRVRLTSTQPGIEVTLERREAPEQTGVLAGANPRLISTQLAAADALFAAAKYDEAIAAYRNIKAQTPALSVVGLQLGNAYLRKKDYNRAEAEFQKVLKSDAANAAACYDLGEVKAARGALDEAAAWYQKAAAADKLWAKPLLRLAVIARDKGDREAAAGYLKKVVAFDPQSADAAQAASLLAQLGRVN